MKTNFMMNASRAFHKVGFTLKKHSPAIFVVGGTIGVVTSTVMACKATLKVNAILDEAKTDINKIHTAMETPELVDSGKYTEKDAKKDLTTVYAQTGLKLVKLYGPAVLVGGVSIASILASYKILNGRNVALSAAYTVVDKSFKDYRKRVKERFGEQVDHELKHNIKAKMVEAIEVDEKTGEEKVVAKTIEVSEIGPEYSEYARFFDEGSEFWEKNAELNLLFLRSTQNYLNDKLRRKGYMFLNEVYRALGIPETQAGQSVGWIYSETNPVGDNYIDFGIYDVSRSKARDFVNGYEKVILLDFNVDGEIYKILP